MKHKSYLLTLAAGALLTLLPTACTDEMNGDGGTQDEGCGVPVQGITFYEAEAFVEDTIAAHQPTIETNAEQAPDMDVMGYAIYDSRTEAKARRAAAANGGIPTGSLEELTDGPNLARDLKRHQRARRTAGGTAAQEGRVVAGRKPAAPVRHKATGPVSGGSAAGASTDSCRTDNQTRSYDVDDTSAIFVAGDSVGVYVVNAGGTVVSANVKYVCNIAGGWNCETPLTYTEGCRYFAYHPYRTDAQLTALGAATGATTDYETFFSDFADKWPVSDDQGTYEKYHACDLLGGEATWNSTTATLGFAMHHLMGMLQLEFGTARIYLDWADERDDHYPYWWTDTVTTALRDGMKLLPKFGGKYRRITRPGSALTVAAADNAWTLRFEAAKSITRGHYQHYDIGRTENNSTEDFYQIFYNQLGDILLRDGRLVHRHDFNRISPNSPVGIVVGTVYPAIDPFSGVVVGPVEDESYNCHSLEREYLYTMAENSRKTLSGKNGAPDTTLVELKPQFIRCLVMSLKDVSYNSSNSSLSYPGSWGAAWSWNEALSHMPNTHCVGVASNNVWSSEELASRVNNPWYPDMKDTGWNAVTACEAFNSLDQNTGSGVATGDGTHQRTPNSGWFIGTAGQYQMAFCFGRERAFGDSWKRVKPRDGHPEDADNDGAVPVWDGHWYNAQYNGTQKIGSMVVNTMEETLSGDTGAQGASTYIDSDSYSKTVGNRTYSAWGHWIENDGETVPTAYHDFDRINDAMQYALGPGAETHLYNKLSGQYATCTLYSDISVDDRFFPQCRSNWNYNLKYWNYQNWSSVVSVNVHLGYAVDQARGRCYYLKPISTRISGTIRPLMAL